MFSSAGEESVKRDVVGVDDRGEKNSVQGKTTVGSEPLLFLVYENKKKGVVGDVLMYLIQEQKPITQQEYILEVVQCENCETRKYKALYTILYLKLG